MLVCFIRHRFVIDYLASPLQEPSRMSHIPRSLVSLVCGFSGGLLFGEIPEQSLLQLARFETERTTAALKRHASLLVNQVESIRHAAVSNAHGVGNRIYQEWNIQLQTLPTLTRDVAALLVRCWLGKIDPHPLITQTPPAIAGVRFTDVDQKEPGPVPISLVEFFQVSGMAAKWPAGKVAENEHDRLLAELRRESYGSAVERREREVGCLYAHRRSRLEGSDFLASQSDNQGAATRSVGPRVGHRVSGLPEIFAQVVQRKITGGVGVELLEEL